MIDTKAVRALADAAEEEWDNEIIPKTLRQCADAIDAKDVIIKQQGELIERIRLDRDALRGQALSSIEREEYFAMKKKAAGHDTLRAENAALTADCAYIAAKRNTLRELVRERVSAGNNGADWNERAEKALGT
jgi:hypothetical protein